MDERLGSGAATAPRTTVTFCAPALPKVRTSTLGAPAPGGTRASPRTTFTGAHRGFLKANSCTLIVCHGLKPGNRETFESEPPAGSARAAGATQHAIAIDASTGTFMAAIPLFPGRRSRKS